MFSFSIVQWKLMMKLLSAYSSLIPLYLVSHRISIVNMKCSIVHKRSTPT
jgi:hypothetical protein